LIGGHADTTGRTATGTLGVGVIGLGVMGRTHIKAYDAAAATGLPCRLVAVCSSNPAELSGVPAPSGNLSAMAGAERVFDPTTVLATTDPAAIAANPAISIVSICTPTDSHADLTVMMLRAGKHVLVEKPVAVGLADVQRVVDAAKDSGRVCMPAMCMRFWPGWDWLKERVQDRSFGRVVSATFTRVGSKPEWSREFYHDPARTGGAMFDLHIHDADIVLWLFGAPRSVRSMGTIDHVTTLYEYPGSGPRHVVAEGAWVSARGFPFRMRYTVEFEGAVADWDLMRKEQLLLVRDGKGEHVPLPQDSAYHREVAHFVEVVSHGGAASATLDDALAVTRLLVAETQSLTTRASSAL
jgi:predicted dehydrogenase